MTARKIIPNMRAAARARLLTLALPVSAIPGNAVIAGDTLTAAGEDFEADGHGPGDYVVLAGFSAANNGLHRLEGVAGNTLTFGRALTNQTVTGGSVTAYMPQVAWERETFHPVEGVPFISEVFRRIGGKPVLFGGQWRHDLLLSLTLQWPSGQGTLGIESMAGRLLELYRPGTGLSFGGNVGKVASADQAPLNEESVWTACAVTASVTAWTEN